MGIITDADETVANVLGKAVIAAIRNNSNGCRALNHPAMNLEIDLGLDSLARRKTFAALEHAFSTEFEGEEAADSPDRGRRIELVKKHGGQRYEVSIELNWGRLSKMPTRAFRRSSRYLRQTSVFTAICMDCLWMFQFVVQSFFQTGGRGTSKPDDHWRQKRMKPDAHFWFVLTIKAFSTRLWFVQIIHLVFSATRFMSVRVNFGKALMTWVSRMLHVVPVNPDTELMRAMRAGAAGLKNGKILHIYPEGERAFDGELHEFKKGAAILATELDLPIVPVASTAYIRSGRASRGVYVLQKYE